MTEPWKPDPDLKAAMEALYGPQPINDGEGFLHHLKANPTLLDPVADAIARDKDMWGPAINRRGEDEVHACLRCGERAHMAIIAETPDKPRWLDLCFDCVRWLREQMHEAEWGSW